MGTGKMESGKREREKGREKVEVPVRGSREASK